MVTKQEYADWRDSPSTQELKREIAEQATNAAGTILNRQSVDVDADQFLKGMLSAFSQVSGWTPEFAPDVEVSDAD